ncbi:hypothetical protein [Marinobacter salarius]|uniref:Uncharacterized protein n=1 Tax=Marinobacter salarius TaxID=1420917 RepID=A0A1W6K4X6_9GAMM|nr:hypothetical protein [Marinobacter salarius]ARM82427.1 hypothetical protein MARSALSMR5_00326 [Marinobacter salarius]
MPLKKLFTKREMESIYSGANSAIWHSHQHARNHAKKATREEDFVATLVTDGVPIVEQRWRDLLRSKGISLRVSGVFCHGHPQVGFGKPYPRIELADLLVVYHHIGRQKTFSRAMLIQAKTSSDGTLLLKPNDLQLKLYSNWPPFEFVTGGLQKGMRDFGKNVSGSRYALVLNTKKFPEEIDWPDQCPWAESPSIRRLEVTQSFARVLGNMLLSKDGRPCSLERPRSDWSKTIKELMEVTGKKTYRRTNIGRGDTPRESRSIGDLANDRVLYCAGDLSTDSKANWLAKSPSMPLLERTFRSLPDESAEDQIVPPFLNDEFEEDGARGISTLLIETHDPEG